MLTGFTTQCSKLLTICHCLLLRLIARYSGHVRDALEVIRPAAVELGLEENMFLVVECCDFDAKVRTEERQAAMLYESKVDICCSSLQPSHVSHSNLRIPEMVD